MTYNVNFSKLTHSKEANIRSVGQEIPGCIHMSWPLFHILFQMKPIQFLYPISSTLILILQFLLCLGAVIFSNHL